MEKYITDPRTGLEYELVGDYYLIAGDDDPAPQPLGLWGRRRLAYLKDHRRSLYNDLLLSGKLEEHLHSIDAAAIDRMKTGAILVNTARGGLVDDCALFKAVESGKLLGAGLDGVEREPLQPDDELFTNDNIVVTPHVGGGTADIGEAIMPMLVEDIRLLLNGQEPRFVVNRQFLAK